MRIYRELKKLTLQGIDNPVNKWTNDLNRYFTKEVQIANKYIKKSSTFLVIKEMQIKMTLRFHLTQIRMAVTNNTNDRCSHGYGGKGTLIRCWWECKLG
jgi:hypothetical protein